MAGASTAPRRKGRSGFRDGTHVDGVDAVSAGSSARGARGGVAVLWYSNVTVFYEDMVSKYYMHHSVALHAVGAMVGMVGAIGNKERACARPHAARGRARVEDDVARERGPRGKVMVVGLYEELCEERVARSGSPAHRTHGPLHRSSRVP